MIAPKALKKKKRTDDQATLNAYTDASREGEDYTGDPGPNAENDNSYSQSSSEDQPYPSRSESTSPLQPSPHSPLGSYPDSRQRSSPEGPRHAVERDSPSLLPNEYRHGSQHIRPHSDSIPRDNRTSQYLQDGQDGQDEDVCGQRDRYGMFSSSSSSYYIPSGSPNGFASVPPHHTHSTRLRRRPPRERYYALAEGDSKPVAAAEEIARAEIDATLPTACRRTTSNAKLKKSRRESGASGSSLRERKLSNGNGDSSAPGELQRSPSRKLKKQRV